MTRKMNKRLKMLNRMRMTTRMMLRMIRTST